jgi:hypothetical protein
MKYLSIPVLIAGLLATGAPTLAQNMPPTPSPAMRQQFEQMRGQMQQIRTQERSQMLAALSPAHRELLSSVVGQLATSTNPDYRSAAQRLDSALSSSEKTAVLNASSNARTKERALFASMRSKFPHPQGASRRPNRPSHAHHTPDAGFMLLSLAGPGPAMGMMGPHGMHR